MPLRVMDETAQRTVITAMLEPSKLILSDQHVRCAATLVDLFCVNWRLSRNYLCKTLNSLRFRKLPQQRHADCVNLNGINANSQLNGQQSTNASLFQGLSVSSGGALQFNNGMSQPLSRTGLQANDKIVDASGRVLTDQKQIEQTVSSANGFRVLRGGQLVELQGVQTSDLASSNQTQGMTIEQKLTRIEQLVREIRQQISSQR